MKNESQSKAAEIGVMDEVGRSEIDLLLVEYLHVNFELKVGRAFFQSHWLDAFRNDQLL